jgi:hypothetical protein
VRLDLLVGRALLLVLLLPSLSCDLPLRHFSPSNSLPIRSGRSPSVADGDNLSPSDRNEIHNIKETGRAGSARALSAAAGNSENKRSSRSRP